MQTMNSGAIDAHMSLLPISVMPTTHCAEALVRMEHDGIGHLVVEGDGVRGVVSRDQALLALRLSPDATLGDVLDPNPLVVPRTARQHDVVALMRSRRASGALVVDGDRVVGILTTSDLLRWLELVLGFESTPTPLEVRARVLAEHVRIRAELDAIEQLARSVIGGALEGGKLRERVRVLEGIVRAHLDLEERLVLPWLRASDGFGAERVRAMEDEHAEQRVTLDGIIRGMFTTRSSAELAVQTLELCRALRDDIVAEERSFLTEDGPLACFVTSGFGG